MPRLVPVQNVFFKHVGKETHTVYWRIRPTALRWQQTAKASVVETLGGYYQEILYADEPQYRGLMLPELVIEGDTGVAYLKEVKRIDWIFRHQGDLKDDGTLAETWFYFLTPRAEYKGLTGLLRRGVKSFQEAVDAYQTFQWLQGKNLNPFLKSINIARWTYSRIQNALMGDDFLNGVARFAPRIYRIHINSFSYDDSVNDPYRIRFVFRCRVLWEDAELWEYAPMAGVRSFFALLGLGKAAQWIKPALDAAAMLMLVGANGIRMGRASDPGRDLFRQIYGYEATPYQRRGESVFGRSLRPRQVLTGEELQAKVAAEYQAEQQRRIVAPLPPMAGQRAFVVQNPSQGVARRPPLATVVPQPQPQSAQERYLASLGLWQGDRYNPAMVQRPPAIAPRFGAYQPPRYSAASYRFEDVRYAPPPPR